MEATDKFLGKTVNDVIMEGNPFLWVSDDCQLPENFEVCNNFPTLNVWAANMSGAMLNLCFRHESSRESLVRAKLKQTERNTSKEEKDEIEEEFDQQRYNEEEEINPIGMSNHRMIIKEFPQVPHHVIIAESLREFMNTLTIKLINQNPDFRSTAAYKNNKQSVRFILEQSCSQRFVFHNELCTTLYTFPLKYPNIYRQVSNINDCNIN